MSRPSLPLGVLGVLGVLAALSLAGASAHGAAAARRAVRRTVTVDVRCTDGQATSSSVTPETVTMVQGDSLDWVLADGANAESFEIVPVDHPRGRAAREWPFADAPGLRRGRRGGSARAHLMRARAAGTYRYDVRAVCRAPGGGTGDEVTIDPDIIIRPE